MEKKINLKIFSSKKNIEIESLVYGFNLFLPTFVLIISSLFKEYSLAAELGILIGINIIFTQIFSANLRSIIISKNNTDNIYSHIVFRFLIAFFVLFVNVIIFYNYNFTYFEILSQITILILIQWQCEIILTYYEIKNNKKKFFQYLFVCFIFSLLIVGSFIFRYNFLSVLIFFNIIFSLFLIIGIFQIDKKLNSIKKIFFNIIKSSAFFSSLTISLSNLVWRLLILILCGKTLAGIYFASFAIGSLPGTLFNNSFGPTMLKKNLKIKYFEIFKSFSYLTITFLMLVSLYHKDKIFFDNQFTQLFGTTISLVGAIFMIKGQYYRQFIIQKTNYKSKLFNYDIIYSLIISLIVPFLFLIGGIKLIIISFLISSLTSFGMYKLIYKNLWN
mgnify:CR=1 FL=1